LIFWILSKGILVIEFNHPCDVPPLEPGPKARTTRYAAGSRVDAAKIPQDWLEGALREGFVREVEDPPVEPPLQHSAFAEHSLAIDASTLTTNPVPGE
jgi:hypothetical protein